MSGIEILLSDSRGVYIPQNFVENFDVTLWGFEADDDDIAILREGPDAEWYWDAWDSVMGRAVYKRGENRWYLTQEGDLFAYCEELMSDSEYRDFFGRGPGVFPA